MGLGRVLLMVGLGIAAVGALLLLAGKWNLPIGRMPGDLVWRSRSTTIYFPFVTCLLVSAVASLLVWLFSGRR